MLGHSYPDLYQYSLLPLLDPDEEEEAEERKRREMDYYGWDDLFEDRL